MFTFSSRKTLGSMSTAEFMEHGLDTSSDDDEAGDDGPAATKSLKKFVTFLCAASTYIYKIFYYIFCTTIIAICFTSFDEFYGSLFVTGHFLRTITLLIYFTEHI